jgi:hypothetical protein
MQQVPPHLHQLGATLDENFVSNIVCGYSSERAIHTSNGLTAAGDNQRKCSGAGMLDKLAPAHGRGAAGYGRPCKRRAAATAPQDWELEAAAAVTAEPTRALELGVLDGCANRDWL